eukprot:COSAG01_NODE_6636_length_3568_cov_5.432113_3_plen_78_part_00
MPRLALLISELRLEIEAGNAPAQSDDEFMQVRPCRWQKAPPRLPNGPRARTTNGLPLAPNCLTPGSADGLVQYAPIY